MRSAKAATARPGTTSFERGSDFAVLNELAERGCAIIENFWQGASDARARFERWFDDPHLHGAAQEIWNWWYVPGHYTYMRTHAVKILTQPVVDSFVADLTAWARAGIAPNAAVTIPWLSMYTDGCRQEMHNDALNGSFGYVLSLTDHTSRQGIGGDTVIWRQGAEARSFAGVEAMGSYSFYDLVEPVFNRLIIFDDRVPHAVTQVSGSPDPLDARLVLHGHIHT